jgi:preprotein translocase subunit YajC
MLLFVILVLAAVAVTVIATLLARKAKAEREELLRTLIKGYEIRHAYVDYGSMPLIDERR